MLKEESKKFQRYASFYENIKKYNNTTQTIFYKPTITVH